MKQSKDPFEVAFEEQEDSPPDSPIAADETEIQTPAPQLSANGGYSDAANVRPIKRLISGAASISGAAAGTSKDKEEDDEEEEENMDVELAKLTTGDPDKMAKMQVILSQFTEEQMSRYESFRRSGFQKSNMKRIISAGGTVH